MKKYLVSCTVWHEEDEFDAMYTFDAMNVDLMYDKLIEQVASEGRTMGKLIFVYSEPA